jgi:hypothetical protein
MEFAAQSNLNERPSLIFRLSVVVSAPAINAAVRPEAARVPQAAAHLHIRAKLSRCFAIIIIVPAVNAAGQI